MGWYDAYKPTNASRVNVARMSSNSGNAARGLGNAFTRIGDTILKVDKARDDEKSSKAKNKFLGIETDKTQMQLDNAKSAKKQQVLDKAYLSSMDDKGNFTAPSDGVDATTKQKGLDFSNAYKKDRAAKNDEPLLKIIPLLDGSENKKLLRDHLYDGGDTSAFKNVSTTALNTLNNSIYADVKAENDTKQQREALTQKEKEMKQAARIEALKIKNAKKGGGNKPLSTAAQNTYMKSLDKDLYVYDINGNRTPKEGITQKQIDFLEGAVNQYMTKPNSDRNIYKARKYALDLWGNSKENINEQKKNEKQINESGANFLQSLLNK